MSDKLEKLVADYESRVIGLVTAADDLEEEMEKIGLMQVRVRIPPKNLGFDPSNRNSTGGQIMEIHLLVEDIAFVGFSWQACAHAICCTLAPGDTACEEFNRKYFTDETLAPITPGQFLFGTLACGHTNAGLRCIEAGTPTATTLIATDGRFDLGRLQHRDQKYADAVHSGLFWKVISHNVRALPYGSKILNIISEARNVEGRLQRSETDWQGLNKIHCKARSYQLKGLSPDWSDIRQDVLRSRPHWAEDIDNYIAFLVSKSGGMEGQYMVEYGCFYRDFIDPSNRFLPGEVFGAAAEIPYPYLAYAVIKTAYTCPKVYIKHRICNWIEPSRVVALKGDKCEFDLRYCEKVLREFREAIPELGFSSKIVDDKALIRIFTQLDTRMGRLLLNKQEKSSVVFSRPEELVYVAACDLFELQEKRGQQFSAAPLLREFGCPPPPPPQQQTPAAKAKASAAFLSLVEIDASGGLEGLAQLRASGFDLNAFVCRKGNADCVYSIISVEGVGSVAKVFLENTTSREVEEVRIDAFLNEWERGRISTALVKMKGWPEGRTSRTDTAKILFNKGL